MILRLLIILLLVIVTPEFVLGATFGQTSAGGSYATVNPHGGGVNKLSTKFTTGALGGTVDSITGYMRENFDGSDDITLFIYADVSNSPGALVDSAIGTVTANGEWISAEATIGATLTGNADYWLGFRNKSTTLTAMAYTDATGYSYIQTSDVDALDDPWSGGTVDDNNKRLSVYVTYTESNKGSTGEQAPASSAQEGSPTTAWTNIDSVFLPDDEYAVYTGTTQDTLYIINFSLGLPAGSTPDSIWISTHASGSASQAARRRFTGFMTKDGTTVVGESASFQHAQTEDVATMTGATTPLFNTTWTATELNASTCGVILWKTSSQAGSMSLDYVTLRVAYTTADGEVATRRRKLILGGK